VYEKYQNHVHKKDKEETRDGYTRFLCQVPLFDPEDSKVTEGADPEPYLKEQQNGSNRDPGKGQPDDERILKDEGVFPKFKGGYHMLHRIDGELVAVGVLDYTHEALSSVYLFYDPKFDFLNLGTL
jgi:arginyl-tRNA--protein-N-Asp/Glu arginylyltransferase